MFSPQIKQAVTAAAYAAYNQMPSLASPGQMASNINKIAIPTLLLLGAHLVQAAEAGPVAYAQCCAATGPWGMLACLPLLLVPGP